MAMKTKESREEDREIGKERTGLRKHEDEAGKAIFISGCNNQLLNYNSYIQ